MFFIGRHSRAIYFKKPPASPPPSKLNGWPLTNDLIYRTNNVGQRLSMSTFQQPSTCIHRTHYHPLPQQQARHDLGVLTLGPIPCAWSSRMFSQQQNTFYSHPRNTNTNKTLLQPQPLDPPTALFKTRAKSKRWKMKVKWSGAYYHMNYMSVSALLHASSQ